MGTGSNGISAPCRCHASALVSAPCDPEDKATGNIKRGRFVQCASSDTSDHAGRTILKAGCAAKGWKLFTWNMGGSLRHQAADVSALLACYRRIHSSHMAELCGLVMWRGLKWDLCSLPLPRVRMGISSQLS
jgi:hypothetical protein